MMMMSFVAIGVVGMLWVLYGYSLAFGNDVGGGLIGNPFVGLGPRAGSSSAATPATAICRDPLSGPSLPLVVRRVPG